MTRPRAAAAFTLLELLIAVVVLTIGVLGIAALIPASIRHAADTTDDLAMSEYAASITAALRLAALQHTYVLREGVGDARRVKLVFLYLPHPACYRRPPEPPDPEPPPSPLDAAGDVDPSRLADALSHRACVVLPYGSDKLLAYPRWDGLDLQDRARIARENGLDAAGAFDPARLRDDVADRAAGEPVVRDVYGGRAEAIGGAALLGHSFAITIRRSRAPALDWSPGTPVWRETPRDGLYQVTIYLFRGFPRYDPADAAGTGFDPLEPGRGRAPIAVFSTEVAAGPVDLTPPGAEAGS